jgi:hypothetical protein
MLLLSLILSCGSSSPLLETMILPFLQIIKDLCRGSCYFGYTAEKSHHLKAKIISKDPQFQEEKIPARKRGRCQVNSEKSIKN